jgi:hypothetical protein
VPDFGPTISPSLPASVIVDDCRIILLQWNVFSLDEQHENLLALDFYVIMTADIYMVRAHTEIKAVGGYITMGEGYQTVGFTVVMDNSGQQSGK